jgi:polyisoprenoid-binding protein YceI
VCHGHARRRRTHGHAAGADKSQITFVSKQMGVPVEGSFKKFDAQVAFDPKKPEGGSVALQIDTASAGFGVPMSDAELPKQPWFDAAHFAQASFQSSAIHALGDGKFEMTGKLTIKGVARAVTVPVGIVATRRQLRGGHRKLYDPAARLQGGRRRMD